MTLQVRQRSLQRLVVPQLHRLNIHWLQLLRHLLARLGRAVGNVDAQRVRVVRVHRSLQLSRSKGVVALLQLGGGGRRRVFLADKVNLGDDATRRRAARRHCARRRVAVVVRCVRHTQRVQRGRGQLGHGDGGAGDAGARRLVVRVGQEGQLVVLVCLVLAPPPLGSWRLACLEARPTGLVAGQLASHALQLKDGLRVAGHVVVQRFGQLGRRSLATTVRPHGTAARHGAAIPNKFGARHDLAVGPATSLVHVLKERVDGRPVAGAVGWPEHVNLVTGKLLGLAAAEGSTAASRVWLATGPGGIVAARASRKTAARPGRLVAASGPR
mmetsp:Transcript_16783/g.52465  ORF Transcript_16783/g.52465 Transcript_16783/m.52465 type:complete len:327 (-) Transcript_16783:590-1570(-)